ncbi:unnamed protein product [Caenorhabditis auriculariae]|uniref:Sex-regulated protein janus-B n=1 Tax=Caenorhabditis auriculariae TaxID=2777116 RepID=A0A8S1H6Z7_9PELO|nr:unnamed protein product [Caenorhabditis auriculariae]
MPLSDVPDVEIDPKGVFKYILIKVTDKATDENKFIVRGDHRHTFHADIFDATKEATPKDFKLKCVGGGRINHEDSKKDILVYGYSQGYGQADHTISVELLKKAYPDYNVHFSNDGY